jgi:uncharacterized integral membrane protein
MAESRRPDRPLRRLQPRWTPRLITLLVLLAIALILMLQNWDHVDINLLFWNLRIRLVWALLSVFLLGAVLGWSVPHLRAGFRRR